MTDAYDVDLSFWNWRLGGLLLVVAALTHILGQAALGASIDPVAIGSVVAVPLLWLRSRTHGVGADA